MLSDCYDIRFAPDATGSWAFRGCMRHRHSVFRDGEKRERKDKKRGPGCLTPDSPGSPPLRPVPTQIFTGRVPFLSPSSGPEVDDDQR